MEEGAEEFFLKPVQLSDVNKLKPHLLKPKVIAMAKKETGIEEKEEKKEDIIQCIEIIKTDTFEFLEVSK